jgi:hypothetical protein
MYMPASKEVEIWTLATFEGYEVPCAVAARHRKRVLAFVPVTPYGGLTTEDMQDLKKVAIRLGRIAAGRAAVPEAFTRQQRGVDGSREKGLGPDDVTPPPPGPKHGGVGSESQDADDPDTKWLQKKPKGLHVTTAEKLWAAATELGTFRRKELQEASDVGEYPTKTFLRYAEESRKLSSNRDSRRTAYDPIQYAVV